MDQPLCTHYTGGACSVNLLTEKLGIQVEVVIGPAHSPTKNITPIARPMLVHGDLSIRGPCHSKVNQEPSPWKLCLSNLET